MLFPQCFHGELILKNVDVTVLSSHPDLFVYYNWYMSSNQIDLTGRHDLNAITIKGPEWKRDESGGYLDVQTIDTLHIPNLMGEYGWRPATFSIWFYLESGGMGFGWDQCPCQFHFRTTVVAWGCSWPNRALPRDDWIHLVITMDQNSHRIYIDGAHMIGWDYFTNDPYQCSNDPVSFFSLSGISGTTQPFKGKIRAVQIFTKTLTETEIGELDYTRVVGIFGEGKLSLINSELRLKSSRFRLRSISLTSSVLESNDVTFDELQSLQLYNDSLVSFTENTMILSEQISIILNSSELYYDGSLEVSLPSLNLIAINSRFQSDVGFSEILVLDLSFSTFESSTQEQEVIVGFFSCSQCQLIGNSQFEIIELCKINSGNFSSSLVVQPSVVNSSVSGEVQLSDSFDFFSHVTFDDVSVSEFQSSGGSITCHSDVLMRNDATFSSTSFYPTLDVILSDSDVILNQDFKLLNFQILSGSGVIFDTTSHSGKILPLPLIVFESNLVLSLSSTVTIQIVDTNTFTKIIVGSTVYLDGTLEVDFDPFKYWSGHEFLLVGSSNLIGEFASVNSTCSSIFKILHTSTSVVGSFDEYIAHLNEVSYISTTGIDDPCCGSFNSPCASFKGVLDRMGRKGKVYFHEGSYSFNQGLGKVSCVDWEVKSIGLGDVMIEGMGRLYLNFCIQKSLFQILFLTVSLIFVSLLLTLLFT
ncbi:hypothetical protein GEMRC1_008752 [Eukaryota sp. GEM-RC1]